MRLRTFLTEVFVMEMKAMMAVRPTRVSTVDSAANQTARQVGQAWHFHMSLPIRSL